MKLRESELVATVDTVSVTELRVWAHEGWVRPADDEAGPVFDEADVARVRLVCDLRDRLEIEEATIPVILSLVDQVHGLRRELRALADAVAQQPESVRGRILSERDS